MEGDGASTISELYREQQASQWRRSWRKPNRFLDLACGLLLAAALVLPLQPAPESATLSTTLCYAALFVIFLAVVAMVTRSPLPALAAALFGGVLGGPYYLSTILSAVAAGILLLRVRPDTDAVVP